MAEEEDTLGPASAAAVALEPSHRTRPNNCSLQQPNSISSLNFADQIPSQHPRVQTAIIGSTNCDSCARGSIDDSHDSFCRTDLQLSQQHQSTVDHHQQQQQLRGFFDDRSSWFSINRPYHSRRKGRRKAVAFSEANRRRRCSPSWSSWSVLTQKDILLAFILFLSTLHLSW